MKTKLFIFAAALTLAACGNKTAGNESTADSAATDATEVTNKQDEQAKEQEKGPVDIDLETFSCTVPEGWHVEYKSDGSAANLSIRRNEQGSGRKFFGIHVRSLKNASESCSAENKIKSTMDIFKEVKDLGEKKFQNATFRLLQDPDQEHTTFIGTIAEGGYVEVVLASNDPSEEDVTAFINSVKIK